jgi:hypothetical protein
MLSPRATDIHVANGHHIYVANGDHIHVANGDGH